MDDEYDVIVLGTGLKECILSGMLSVAGKNVLHMDRNPYYGGESASLNLDQVFKKFDAGDVPAEFGRSRDYNIDMCPKFMMAQGDLVKILIHTKAHRYLEFKSVKGSYVVKDQKVHKVPSTPKEALSSSLMGMFQKRRFKNFLVFAEAWEEDKPETHAKIDLKTMTPRQLFDHYKLDVNTKDFTAHAIALQRDEKYMDDASQTIPFVKALQLYASSVACYGNSPYIYPDYGLGGLPEGFSRLAAIHGGTYMLARPIDEVVYNDDGTVQGVKHGEHFAKCKQILGDPSYFSETGYFKKTGQVARWIFIMSHPVPNTKDCDSCQIIIPAHQVGRQSDIYVSCVSNTQNVAPQGKYIACIQANVETNNPQAELQCAVNLLGPTDKDFFSVSDVFVPSQDVSAKNVFLTESYDPTSHFQTCAEEVLKVYHAMTGDTIDLSKPPTAESLDPYAE